MPTQAVTIHTKPVGAPRQSRRDTWAPRPCVLAYRAFRDKIRLAFGAVPPAETVEEIVVIAEFAMPATWSAKRLGQMLGRKKRTKPDGDNVLKAVIDALWDQDSAIGDCTVRRRWGVTDAVTITIHTMEGKA